VRDAKKEQTAYDVQMKEAGWEGNVDDELSATA
jgi:hypothetical protein